MMQWAIIQGHVTLAKVWEARRSIIDTGSSTDDLTNSTGYNTIDIANLASGHVVVIITVTMSMLLYMFLVDRWRALRKKKKNKSLKTNSTMLVHTNTNFPSDMQQVIRRRYEVTSTQRMNFEKTVPIGAEQHGWGNPSLPKLPRWKKKVSDTAKALDKIFARDEQCAPRGHTESIVDFGQRLANMERYRDLASVIKMYVEKYELAKFSRVEMVQDDLDQAHSYLQQMLGSVQQKLKMDAYGVNNDGTSMFMGAVSTLPDGVQNQRRTMSMGGDNPWEEHGRLDLQQEHDVIPRHRATASIASMPRVPQGRDIAVSINSVGIARSEGQGGDAPGPSHMGLHIEGGLDEPHRITILK